MPRWPVLTLAVAAIAGAAVLLPKLDAVAPVLDATLRAWPAWQAQLPAALAMAAVLTAWVVWHADGPWPGAGLRWLASCLLGSGLLRAAGAPAAAASLLGLFGVLGAARAVAPGWRRGQPGQAAGLAEGLAAAAVTLVAQSSLLAQSASSGPGLFIGHLLELAALLLLDRAALHPARRQPLQAMGELADALQAVASPLLLADAGGRIRWVNQALCRATGYQPDELVGRPATLLDTPDPAPGHVALRAAQQAALRAGQAWRGQLPVRRRDGSTYLDDRRSTPVHDEFGRVTGQVWVGDDVTERIQAELRLRHSEESLRRLVDHAPDAIIVADGHGRILQANPRVLELLGYTPGELTGMDLKQLMPAAAASQHDRHLQGHDQGPRSMTAAGRDVQALRKDGSRVDVHVQVGEMPDLGGRRFVGFMRDMTERRRAEAALRHSEEKLRKLYDLSPLGIALTDMEGRFIDFNQAFLTLCGCDAPTLRSLSYWDLTPVIYEADEERNLALLQETGRYGPYEKEYRRPTGELLPVRLNGVRIELDGRPYIWSIVEDLTQHRRAEVERERLQRQLMQSQKMEALGQLTGGVAHDFNNMLTGILGLSTLALERHVQDPAGKVATYLREIARVSERGRDLIERLMRFARPQAPQAPLPRPLRPVVEEVLRMLESALPPQLTVRLGVEPALPEACFVEVDLHQVLTNLVINARDALGGRGEVQIELAGTLAAGCECSSCGQRVYGPHAVLRVLDDGCGIPPALLMRIFDPFFTTKDFGKGTGLGLAMVHSLVHQAGGHVLVSSEPGCGTRFEVLLPVADVPAAAGPDGRPAGGERPMSRATLP